MWANTRSISTVLSRYAAHVLPPLFSVTFKPPRQLRCSYGVWPLLWQTWRQRVAGSWTDGHRAITSPWSSKFPPLALQVSLAKVSDVLEAQILLHSNKIPVKNEVKEEEWRKAGGGGITGIVIIRIWIFNSLCCTLLDFQQCIKT